MIIDVTPQLKRVLLQALQSGKLDTDLITNGIDPLVIEVIDSRTQVDSDPTDTDTDNKTHFGRLVEGL